MRAPRTARDLRALFEARGLRPRSRFGQNFLVDPNVVDAILRDAGVGPGETVLEIGPGPGILTDRLLDAGAFVVAVEIDADLHALLQEQFAGEGRLALLHRDVLESKHRIAREVLDAVDAARAGGAWRVVANLPYQVAAPVIGDLIGLPEPPVEILATVQLEVADRLASPPGRPEYGPLSVAVALASSSVETLRTLPPDVFWPRPKVRSAVVRIRPDVRRRDAAGDWGAVETFLRRAFRHRRKALRGGLRHAAGVDDATLDAAFAAAEVDPGARAETLSPETLLALGRELGQVPPTP